MVLSDYDEKGQWAPGVYEEKLAEHEKEKALKDRQEADYKKSWSPANWTKAMVAMISLDEEAWTALASGTVDDWLMDSTKTTPEEFALQVSMLAVIVLAGKAGEVGGARSGRASSSRNITTAEIYEQARAEGINLPTDNAFELRINELTREFNAQTPAAKRATIQNGLDIRLSEAQTRFESADTPLLKSQRKLKLDEANRLKIKFEGDYAKSDEGKSKGKELSSGSSGMFLDVESSGSYTKGKAFTKSELKEMESEGLLARQRAKAAVEVAKAAKARADARQSTADKLQKQKEDLEAFGKKARDVEKEKDPLKTSELEDGLDDALDPNQENPTPTPTPEEPIDIFLKNNPQATQTEINNFKGQSPEVQKQINDFRSRWTPEQIARGLEATRKAREARIKADKAIEDAKNNPEEEERDDPPSETTPLIDKDEPELTEDPKPRNTKVYPEDNPLLDKLEAQGYELTQGEIDMLRDDFGFDYENELNPLESTETRPDPNDLLDFDEGDLELTDEEKKELLDKYGFDFDRELNPAQETETTEDPRDLLDDDEVERDEANPIVNKVEGEGEDNKLTKDNKGPTTGKKNPSISESAAAAALIIGQSKSGGVIDPATESGGGSTRPPGPYPNTTDNNIDSNNQFTIKNTLSVKNIDELLKESFQTSKTAYDDDFIGSDNYYNIRLPYNPQNDINKEQYSFINICFNLIGGILYCGFRGTDANDIGNIITDFNETYSYTHDIELFSKITDITLETDIQAHSGNLLGLASIYQRVRDEIDVYYKTPHVVFCGHSLGNALACLMNFIYIHDITNQDKKIDVLYTIGYGGPRFLIDDERYIRNYNTTCPNVIRVFNYSDPVPYLPTYLYENVEDEKIPVASKIIVNSLIGVGLSRGLPGITLGILGSLMGSSSLSKYTGLPSLTSAMNNFKNLIHVGQALDLDRNIQYNNINNLIETIANKGESVLKNIYNDMKLDKKDSEELFKLLTSEPFRIKLLAGTMHCFAYTPQLEKVNTDMIAQFVLNKIEYIKDYNQKCRIVKPLLLDKLFELLNTPKSNILNNYELSVISQISVTVGIDLFKEHSLDKYQSNLDTAINKEVNSRRAIFGGNTLYASDYQEGGDVSRLDQEVSQKPPITINQSKEEIAIKKIEILPKIQGIYIGPYTNYEFIEY